MGELYIGRSLKRDGWHDLYGVRLGGVRGLARDLSMTLADEWPRQVITTSMTVKCKAGLLVTRLINNSMTTAHVNDYH